MNSDWRPALGWEPLELLAKDPKGTCILDEASCDGFPLANALISGMLRAREGPALVLISMRWPVASFVTVGRRLGHDLNLATMQGRFSALDGASSTSSNPKFKTMNLDDVSPETIGEIARRAVDEHRQQSPARPVVILVEGISQLSKVGWPLVAVFRLVQFLELLSVPLIISSTRDGLADVPLRRWLAHRMDTIIIPKALEAGVTRQAHGEFLMLSGKRDGRAECRRALFKCTESSLLVAPKNEPASLVDFINLL